MVTGKKEPTGVELHMTIAEAELIQSALDSVAYSCERTQGDRSLPIAVRRAAEAQGKEHLTLRYSIVDVYR